MIVTEEEFFNKLTDMINGNDTQYKGMTFSIHDERGYEIRKTTKEEEEDNRAYEEWFDSVDFHVLDEIYLFDSKDKFHHRIGLSVGKENEQCRVKFGKKHADLYEKDLSMEFQINEDSVNVNEEARGKDFKATEKELEIYKEILYKYRHLLIEFWKII